MGVEFRREEVSGTIALEQLEREFDFIFIGVGLGAMERLGIPGDDLPGVIDALRFIERYKTQPDFETGQTVIVIGAGNTAIDAANAAVRLGAKDVHLFYRRTRKFFGRLSRPPVGGVRFRWLEAKAFWRSGRAAAASRSAGRASRQIHPGTEFEVSGMVIPHRQTRLTAQLNVDIRSAGSWWTAPRPPPSEILRRRRLRERRTRGSGRGGRRQARRARHGACTGGKPWLT
jgi:glutamate synthase (NADPH/NADH) small chain